MCVCVFPETTTHFESLLSRIKAASKERKRERRTTTTNALRLVGLGRRSPGYVFCILLLLKRCEEITTTHTVLLSLLFFYLVFFCINLEWDKNGKKSSMMVSSSQTNTVKSKKRFVFWKKCQTKNNPKKKSMKTLNRDLRKKKHTKRQKLWKVEYGLKEKLFWTTQQHKKFLYSHSYYTLSLSITLSLSPHQSAFVLWSKTR